MSWWSAMAIVLVVAVMTYSMRAVAIVGLADRTIPTWLERALRNVGPAVLAALAVNLAAGGTGGPSLPWPETAAMVITGVVAWRTRSVLWSLGAGMATLWIASAFV